MFAANKSLVPKVCCHQRIKVNQSGLSNVCYLLRISVCSRQCVVCTKSLFIVESVSSLMNLSSLSKIVLWAANQSSLRNHVLGSELEFAAK